MCNLENQIRLEPFRTVPKQVLNTSRFLQMIAEYSPFEKPGIHERLHYRACLERERGGDPCQGGPITL